MAEQHEAVSLHMKESFAHYGYEFAGRSFRKFGISYSELHPMGDSVRQAFINAKTTEDVVGVLSTWYDPSRPWPEVRSRQSLRHLIAAGASDRT